jgi:hypothetical protein
MVIQLSCRKSIIYFSSPGEKNTEETFAAVKARAEELNITDIVIASTRGGTGLAAVDAFPGFNVVVVPHVTGLREPGIQTMSEDMQAKIRKKGGTIVIASHAFLGVGRAVQTKFDTVGPVGIIAQVLRMFGQGMKVVVEIVAMAADAGVIPIDKDVIAIAGSGRGADTAIVIQAANTHRLFDTVIKEIIAKPNIL